MKYTFQVNYGTDYRILTYEYDAFDRRVNSHTISVSTGLAVRTTYWIWDGQQLALQYSDGDGAGPNAPSLTYRFLYGPQIDQLLVQRVAPIPVAARPSMNRCQSDIRPDAAGGRGRITAID